MRRFTALLALILILCSACGCSGQTKDAVSGSLTAEEAGSQPRSLPQQESSAQSEPEQTLSLGTVNGGVYENEYFGIGCKLNENWIFSVEDELASMTGVTAESLENEELRELLLSSDVFFDMHAATEDGLLSMALTIENLGAFTGLAVSETEIMEASSDVLNDSLDSLGLEDCTVEAATVTLAGAEHPAYRIHGLIEGVDFYEMQIGIKRGDYFATLTFASVGMDLTDRMLGYFYAV